MVWQASERLGSFKRNSRYLQQPIFNLYHSEHEMLRYLKRLENRDLSLCHSMIALVGVLSHPHIVLFQLFWHIVSLESTHSQL